ncbi:MAG: CMP deaminase [Caulobacteraceae bacterium]|nr:CMP deaminase [Caulobacteraceae bacterium]
MATLHHNTAVDWLRVAAKEAAAGSDDTHTQNGAVLVPRAAAYVCVGVNRVPSGVWAAPDRLARPEKYQWIEHAERAAIYRAARIGTPTAGATLYCPWFACMDCARAIILAGIVEVVGHVRPRAATPERWTSQIVKAESMLREARVGMRWIAEPLGVTIRFDGQEMEL